MNDDKSDYAGAVVLFIFVATASFSYLWDALVKVGWLNQSTISQAIHLQLEGQVSVAFLLGYLVCHLIRG